jgi:hypothetical protein
MDLSFKNVLKLLNLFSSDFNEVYKQRKGLEILGVSVDKKDTAFVLNEIAKYVFNTQNKGGGTKVFDLELDYKYYWADFKKMGIDLNTEKISWWEFDTILEAIFLQEHSTIGKVIQYRTYEKPTGNYKVSEQKEHNFYLQKKREYALKDNSDRIKSENNLRLMAERAKDNSKN